ncbi:MAG: hypothetical protein JWL92_348 [Candidatus Nomurabacteria bacterium]|nr:hypothetical protein [Candidatus Nomurabacteria bacterium]
MHLFCFLTTCYTVCMKKPMTIEDLAEMLMNQKDSTELLSVKMSEGFEKVDLRFEAIDKHLDSLNHKIESEIEKLASITVRQFTFHDEKLSQFRTETSMRFDEVHQSFATIRHSLFTLDERFVSKAQFESYVNKNSH